nr:aminopeptidase M1 [Tanacetum cinerariifolium]
MPVFACGAFLMTRMAFLASQVQYETNCNHGSDSVTMVCKPVIFGKIRTIDVFVFKWFQIQDLVFNIVLEAINIEGRGTGRVVAAHVLWTECQFKYGLFEKDVMRQSTLKAEKRSQVVAARVLWTECQYKYGLFEKDVMVISKRQLLKKNSMAFSRLFPTKNHQIMSTYLVAAVDGLFGYVEDHTTDGTSPPFSSSLPVCYHLTISYPFARIKVRVYCQAGKANQGMLL